MKAMILAAGRGERMGRLTEQIPKPLLEVQGKPLIRHTVERIRQAGITNLVINTAYLGEQIETCLGDGVSHGVHIRYSRESEALETGGGIAKALHLLTDEGERPFLLVNSDVWTDMDLGPLKQALKENILAHLVLVKNPSHNPEGDFAFSNGRVCSLPEETGHEIDSYTYSGIAVIHPQLFSLYAPEQKKFRLLPLLLNAMEQQQVSAEIYEGTWVDVGTPERLEQVNRAH